MKNLVTISTIIALSLITGCTYLKKRPQIKTLQELNSNQKYIKEYVQQQKSLFSKLIADIKEQKLKEGTPQKQIIATYGEPVISGKTDNRDLEEFILYRSPVQFYSTKKVYLYFDNNDKLSSWKIENP